MQQIIIEIEYLTSAIILFIFAAHVAKMEYSVFSRNLSISAFLYGLVHLAANFAITMDIPYGTYGRLITGTISLIASIILLLGIKHDK